MPQDPHTRALVGIVAAIDNLTNVITTALGEHAGRVETSTAAVVAAIDRLVGAQTPAALSVDALATPIPSPGDHDAAPAAS